MTRVLLPVYGAKGRRSWIGPSVRLFLACTPPAVILLPLLVYGGPSAVDGMSSDAELAELRDAIEGTPEQEARKAKAEAMFAAPRAFFEEHGYRDVHTVIRSGRAADEIVNAAVEHGAELIVVGNTRSLIDRLMLGDVAHQVAKGAAVPVLLAR